MKLLLRDEFIKCFRAERFFTEMPQACRGVLNSFDSFQIETVKNDAKKETRGAFSTNLGFVLAKKLADQLGREVFPLPLSSELVEQMDESKYIGVVEGGGFINVVPTLTWVRKFLVTPELNNFHPDPFHVDWANKRLRERLNDAEGEEAFYFLAKLRKPTAQLVVEESLQLLALLADKELSSTPYLTGLGGSENIPWYLNQFASRSQDLMEGLHEPTLGEKGLKPYLDKLLSFRGDFHTCVLTDRPDRALALVIALVREFFSYFNRPEIRQALLLKSEEGRDFEVLSHLCRRYVLRTIAAFRFT